MVPKVLAGLEEQADDSFSYTRDHYGQSGDRPTPYMKHRYGEN